eukprot:TRINITY_DN9818_c0_g2_i3.p1 TRINITY_DN9818_c0_g2~~TRINITY_DN9818_c0_g2_i3.p1  ORF type:complete len:382 (-),score=58.06 TRINITY_DN9818_c0_g2_i3:162-1259(-)
MADEQPRCGMMGSKGRKPKRSSEQVVALPSIPRASKQGGRRSGLGLQRIPGTNRSELTKATAWARAARLAFTKDDPDQDSDSSEDEGDGLRPAAVASSSELAEAAAWARAARLAFTKDDPDQDSDSSEDEGDGLLPAAVASGSELSEAAAWARAARLAFTKDDPDQDSDSSEDEGEGLRAADVASNSELAEAAAWARAARLAFTKDDPDQDSDSSEDEGEGLRAADVASNSELAEAAAWARAARLAFTKARSAFVSVINASPDADISSPRDEVEPALSFQHASPSSPCHPSIFSTSARSIQGACGEDVAGKCLQDSESRGKKSTSPHTHRQKFVRFAPSVECEGSEIATPATVKASSSFPSETLA